jgi:hypothetical protein
VDLTNLGSELEKCVGSRVHLVGAFISFEKNFYRLPFTPPSLVRRIGPSQGYDDAVLRAEALEKELSKARKHSTMLQLKLDGAFA